MSPAEIQAVKKALEDQGIHFISVVRDFKGMPIKEGKDDLATVAMQAILSRPDAEKRAFRDIARESYEMAKEMLAVRGHDLVAPKSRMDPFFSVKKIIEDQGLHFPSFVRHCQQSKIRELEDDFAKAAMHGMLARRGSEDRAFSEIARESYAMAQEMLAARDVSLGAHNHPAPGTKYPCRRGGEEVLTYNPTDAKGA